MMWEDEFLPFCWLFGFKTFCFAISFLVFILIYILWYWDSHIFQTNCNALFLSFPEDHGIRWIDTRYKSFYMIQKWNELECNVVWTTSLWLWNFSSKNSNLVRDYESVISPSSCHKLFSSFANILLVQRPIHSVPFKMILSPFFKKKTSK